MSNQSPATINNDEGGVINNYSSEAIVNKGIMNNFEGATINNTGGTLIVLCDAIFNNLGTLLGDDIVFESCDEVALSPSQDSFIRAGARNTNEGDNTILMLQKLATNEH